MIPIIEDYGDIELHKFLFIRTKKLGLDNKWEQFYDSRLKGYLIDWSYTYNKYTGDTSDRVLSHSDMIDSLPYELSRLWRTSDEISWGKQDFYRDGVRFFYTNSDMFTSGDRKYLKSIYSTKDDVREATNASSIGGGHVGSIDIIGSAPVPVHPDLKFDLDYPTDKEE